MRFLKRWLSHSVRLALALLLAVIAMQAPAFTHDYATALLQVSADARRDVDQRETAARHYYSLPAGGDDASLIQALQAHEPANAETLAHSVDRVSSLQAARGHIDGTMAIFQPMIALADAAHDPGGYKAAIWRTELQTYTIHLDLTLAAIFYGAVGLLLGSLLGHVLCLPFDIEPRRADPYISRA
ncbi:MAG TPA: DUF2937 family protein [Stellaceae bacterium]|jgi:hypothetical protein|nr:DUF2937 family protein [Stellaceae bacterium]